MDQLLNEPYLLAAGCALTTVVMARYFAADIYDVIIVNMTKRWYREVLQRLNNNAKVLDVGIGTGTSLIKNQDIIQGKELQVVGVDYEPRYVNKAQQSISKHGLEKQVSVHCASVYDEALPQQIGCVKSDPNTLFDCVYFSGSFTLLPDPVEALHSTAKLLKPNGKSRIYITQTYQRAHTPFLGVIKPLLKYMTTIDFGQLTYEADLLKILKASNMRVEENIPIQGSVDNAFQVARVIVLDPSGKYEKSE